LFDAISERLFADSFEKSAVIRFFFLPKQLA
jgi:hypothetical protein